MHALVYYTLSSLIDWYGRESLSILVGGVIEIRLSGCAMTSFSVCNLSGFKSSKHPAYILRNCKALFNSLLAAGLHTALPKMFFPIPGYSFLKLPLNIDIASKLPAKLNWISFRYMSFTVGLGCANMYLAFF